MIEFDNEITTSPCFSRLHTLFQFMKSQILTGHICPKTKERRGSSMTCNLGDIFAGFRCALEASRALPVGRHAPARFWNGWSRGCDHARPLPGRCCGTSKDGMRWPWPRGPKMGAAANCWVYNEHPITIDDLGVPPHVGNFHLGSFGFVWNRIAPNLMVNLTNHQCPTKAASWEV